MKTERQIKKETDKSERTIAPGEYYVVIDERDLLDKENLAFN